MYGCVCIRANMCAADELEEVAFLKLHVLMCLDCFLVISNPQVA
jgi:hypothetical protein